MQFAGVIIGAQYICVFYKKIKLEMGRIEKMKEVIRVTKEFFNENHGKIQIFESQEDSIRELFPFLEQMEDFDKPDAFSVIGNKALIIEHFEFDSTHSNSKGSSNRIEQARVEREFTEEINKKELQPGETFMRHDVLPVHHSIENYIKNAVEAFNNHYEKIESYICNLMKEGKITRATDVKVMFWIEDTTFMGNFFRIKSPTYDTPRQELVLLYCDKFLDVLETCEKLDYILCFSHYGPDKFCCFLDMNHINDYREIQVRTEDIEIIDFEPHVISAAFAFDGEAIR